MVVYNESRCVYISELKRLIVVVLQIELKEEGREIIYTIIVPMCRRKNDPH